MTDLVPFIHHVPEFFVFLLQGVLQFLRPRLLAGQGWLQSEDTTFTLSSNQEHTQMDDRDRVIIDSRDYAVHKHKSVILCDSASWMKKKTKLKEKATAKENQTNG